MFQSIYPHRFVLFFISQIVILFGSLLIPDPKLEDIVLALFFIVNISAGIILVSKNRLIFYAFVVLLLYMIFNFLFDLENKDYVFKIIKMCAFFIFYGIVTIQIIKQVWESKIVNRNIILGLISGYISLGLIGFFICLAIEVSHPGSFEGLNTAVMSTGDVLTERLMYFSYITLLTIGYGDILPVTLLAQKAAILIGLLGQIYLVVITAIVVGKYVNQSSN